MPRPAEADAPVFTAQDAAAAPAVPVSAAAVEEGKEVDARWGHHHHHIGGNVGYGNYGESGYNGIGLQYLRNSV